MKDFLIGFIALAALSVLSVGCGSTDNAPVGQGEQDLSGPAMAVGGLQHVYARPDERLCPSPACGGDWLVVPTFHNACHDQPSNTYVAGIYAGNQQISPPCDELLTGTLVKDPRDPEFLIFELEL
jgi:hypothetical protein